MGKEKELLEAVRTKNVEQARKIVSKLKKTAGGTQNKKKNYIDIQDEHGFSILHHCALHGYADVLKDVIDLGGSVSLMDNKGMTPLHMAAFGGRYESCQVLLMRNADPNAGTRTGDTPLHIVSIHGYAKIAEVLINERANCNLQNVSGQTPLDLACENGNNEIVSLLLNTGQCVPKISGLQTPVHLAAKQGHVQCLRLLVGHGYSVNTIGANGTPLHEAALYGKTEAVKFLIEVGADVTIPNNHGLTPLEVINHYTDPRSGHNLKLLLQGAVDNAAKIKQQQLRSEPPSHPLSRPPSSRSHHQVQPPSDSHPPHSPNQPPPPGQPHPPSQSHPHHQQQSMDQPPNWKPEEPRGYAIGGNPSLAAMIAAKAASRKPMVTSPTKKENIDHQQQPYSSAQSQAIGYESSYQNHQHPTTVSSPHYHPPPNYGTKPANSQQASHAPQPVQHGSQQVSYSSEHTKYTSQQPSHTSQPVHYTSQQAFPPKYASQQASHTSQLESQQTSHVSHPERYTSQQPSHPERYTSRQASHTSQPTQYASQQTSHASQFEGYTSQQASHTSHPERYAQQGSHASHPERYTQQASHASHTERYTQQASHTSHPERYTQQASHTSHPERYTQQASHASHPERYAQQGSHASHSERYPQQASHASHSERYAQQASHTSHSERYVQQASHTSHPAQSLTTTTTGNVPTRSASMRYATSDSEMPTNPVGYLPGASYTTEHIGRERSSSADNELSLEGQSRTRSYTVHDTPAVNNVNHSLQRPAKKPKPTPSTAKDDSKSIGQPNRSVSVESASDQLSAPPDTIQLLGQAGLRKSGKRPVPVPQKSTEPSEDNELMQKLRRRQHKIEEGEIQVTPDQQEQISSTDQTTDHLVEPSKTDDKDDREQVTSETSLTHSTQYTTSPSQYTTTLSQYTTSPSQYTTSPSQYTTTSSQYTTNPSQYTTTSSQYTTSPSQYTTSPSQYTSSSSQYTTSSQYAAALSQYTTSPSQYTTSKPQYTVSTTTNPAQYTANPAQYTANPAQYTANPAQYTANPAQYTANLAQYTTNPAQYTANPAQYITNPAQYTANPAQYTANPAQYTVNSSQYNSSVNTATTGSVMTSTASTQLTDTDVTTATTTELTTPTTTSAASIVAVTTPTISAVTTPITVANDPPTTTVPSDVTTIKTSPVLEKKSATGANINDFSQSKNTRPSTPPSSAANTNLTAMDYASGLSITSSLSSSSISSASTNPAAVAMSGSNVEAIAISEWLMKYKLSDYITIFQQAGFDNTDFIAGITAEELIDIGVTKIGHRKKIMTAVQTSQLKEPILTKKPASVKEWLSLCGLIQYHQILLDAGYDDIDFIADITRDELIEVGVSKYAHLKRLMKSIGQLLELTDSGTASASSPTPSSGSSTPVIQATNLTNQNAPASSGAPTTNTNVNQNLLPATSEDTAADHMITTSDKKGITRQGAVAMDPMVASRKGPPPVPTRASSTTLTDEQRRQQQQQDAMVTGPPDGSHDAPPVKVPPKVAKKPKPNKKSTQPQASTELEYLEDDIIAGLGKDDGEDEMVSELTSDLDLALQGFGEEPAETDELNANKDSDDLFGELDDMLADLNAQLNVM